MELAALVTYVKQALLLMLWLSLPPVLVASLVGLRHRLPPGDHQVQDQTDFFRHQAAGRDARHRADRGVAGRRTVELRRRAVRLDPEHKMSRMNGSGASMARVLLMVVALAMSRCWSRSRSFRCSSATACRHSSGWCSSLACRWRCCRSHCADQTLATIPLVSLPVYVAKEAAIGSGARPAGEHRLLGAAMRPAP